MLGRLCCVNFRLPGVGFCRSGVRYRRLGVRCPLPVRVSSLNLSALRARNFRLNGDWDACAAGNFTCRAGEHLSALLPFGYGISPSGEDGTPVRRAARWGRFWGCAPLRGPPCIPPGAPPQEGSSASLVLRGHAAQAAGASFPRYAQSGDLPPRRVNGIVRFRFGQNPLQRNIPTMLYALKQVMRCIPYISPDELGKQTGWINAVNRYFTPNRGEYSSGDN